MSQTRQLAAIMFSDIVGYTALMSNDEQKAFELLHKNRQIQKPIIEQYNGFWIKELGDGVTVRALSLLFISLLNI
jgi:class 3 adenylate cyclase